MARSHAKITVGIWGDEDWHERSIAAQWLYTALLAHPRLSLVGTLDVWPSRWARIASDADEETVTAALDELRTHGYVVVDEATDEAAIRTFTRHDLRLSQVNKNLAAGFWSAWRGVMSPVLRSIIVHEVPDPLWDALANRTKGGVPADAAQTRRSPRLEPEPLPRFEPDVHLRLEPQPPSRLEPTPPPPPPPPSTADSLLSSQSDSRPEPHAADETRRDAPAPAIARTERARLITDRIGQTNHERSTAAGTVRSTDAHLAACQRSAWTDHHEQVTQALHADPAQSDERIANTILGRGAVPLTESRHPAVLAQAARDATPDVEPVASHAHAHAAADIGRAALAAARTTQATQETP